MTNSTTEFSAAEVALDHVLKYFHYSHLPDKLKARSKPFCDLARLIIDTTPCNPERTVALRKLLEAKDAAVRAGLWSQEATPDELVVFLAKDNAFAAILQMYRDKCIELGADQQQVQAVNRMLDRLQRW